VGCAVRTDPDCLPCLLGQAVGDARLATDDWRRWRLAVLRGQSEWLGAEMDVVGGSVQELEEGDDLPRGEAERFADEHPAQPRAPSLGRSTVPSLRAQWCKMEDGHDNVGGCRQRWVSDGGRAGGAVWAALTGDCAPNAIRPRDANGACRTCRPWS
jgi:hypothetical protein